MGGEGRLENTCRCDGLTEWCLSRLWVVTPAASQQSRLAQPTTTTTPPPPPLLLQPPTQHVRRREERRKKQQEQGQGRGGQAGQGAPTSTRRPRFVPMFTRRPSIHVWGLGAAVVIDNAAAQAGAAAGTRPGRGRDAFFGDAREERIRRGESASFFLPFRPGPRFRHGGCVGTRTGAACSALLVASNRLDSVRASPCWAENH